MQLTRAADYGVRVMIHLAGLPGGTRVNRAELARAADVSESFMSKILQRLAGSQLIRSHRGKGGGFELAQSDERISLLDVVTALEGPICLNVCLMPGETCNRRGWCAARLVWARAQATLMEVLAGESLEDLARVSAMRRARPGLDQQGRGSRGRRLRRHAGRLLT